MLICSKLSKKMHKQDGGFKTLLSRTLTFACFGCQLSFKKDTCEHGRCEREKVWHPKKIWPVFGRYPYSVLCPPPIFGGVVIFGRGKSLGWRKWGGARPPHFAIIFPGLVICFLPGLVICMQFELSCGKKGIHFHVFMG